MKFWDKKGWVFFLLLIAQCSLAQQIDLHFPHFAGNHWDLILLRGQQQDTVLSGLIPPDGRVQLRLPEKYRQYSGMGRWMLREGGGIDMVLNGEQFSVECLSATPDDSNIIYKGSPENDFLRNNHQEQERLLMQYEAIQMLERAYAPGNPLYAAAQDEKVQLEKAWAAFRARLAASPLYAARFREIVDLTRGIGGKLQMSEPERASEVDDFMRRRMSWAALYTSNHWSGVIYNWVQMHLLSIRADAVFLSSARNILARMPNEEVYTSFCEYMARYLVKEGKDSLLTILGPEIRSSGKLLNTSGMLSQYVALQAGEQAPALQLTAHETTAAGHSHSTTVKGVQELAGGEKVLLVFYQSGCGPCESMLEQLLGSYPFLQQKQVRVISFSADTDLQTFENTARQHPWSAKFCDEQGISGPNFKQYGVVGTPTLFLLDATGQVLLRTASISSVLESLQ